MGTWDVGMLMVRKGTNAARSRLRMQIRCPDTRVSMYTRKYIWHSPLKAMYYLPVKQRQIL